MQLIRTKGKLRMGRNIFSERKEKENHSLFFALWRSFFYLCILKFPNNQLLMKKKHLTEGQRYEIFALLQSNRSQKDIAIQLKVNKSTISREISHNYEHGIDWSFDGDTDRIIRKWCKRKGIDTAQYNLGFHDYLGNSEFKHKLIYFKAYYMGKSIYHLRCFLSYIKHDILKIKKIR